VSRTRDVLSSLRVVLVVALSCLPATYSNPATADSQEVLALKAYADFKMGLYESAFSQFEYLASLNNTQGLLNLSIMLDEGLGCDADPARATKLLQQASGVGHLNAIERLAARYQSGKFIERDIQQASELHKKAAQLGSVESMYQLFVIYSEKDPDKADHWLTLAKRHGHPIALLANQLQSHSGVSPEAELRIRAALESIDRAANNRFADGVIYYIAHRADIVIETDNGLKQNLTKDQLRYLWNKSFKRGDSNYRLVRTQIELTPIDSKRIRADSTLRETFDHSGENNLVMRERSIISLNPENLFIQSIHLTIE